MSRVLNVLVCLSVVLYVFSGCNKVDDTTIISDRTRVPEENSDLLSSLFRGDTLLLVYKTGVAIPTFAPDDIVVGRSGDGYLKRVLSSSVRGDTLVLATEQASLTDAIEKYATDTTLALSVDSTKMQSLRIDTTCVGDDGKEYRVVIQSLGPTVTPLPIGNQFEVRLPNVSLEISDGGGVAAYISYDSIILQKGLDIDLGLRIDKAEVSEFRAIAHSTEGVRFKGGRLGFVKSIASIEEELELARVPLGHIVILTPTVPPVPIVFTFGLGVYFGLGANLSIGLSGEILNSASISCTTSVGARYESSAWQPVYECSPTASADFSFSPPAGGITAKLREFLRGSFETKVYGVAGPTLYVKPYRYDKITAPPAKLEVGAGVAAGLGFKVEVLSKKLLGYDWTFADYEWVIAETTFSGGGNNPPSTPSTPTGPSSGRVGTSYDFTSSATDPDGDSVALRFDWGDGDTSNWSSYVSGGTPVTVSHSWSTAGTFSVKAQAKDPDGSTSQWSAALSVSISAGTPHTVTIQPGPADGNDSYIEMCVYNPPETTRLDYNNGSDTMLNVQCIDDFDFHQRAVISFPLNDVPTGSTVDSATMWLHGSISVSVAGIVDAYALEGPWSEGTITWRNAPDIGDYLATETGEYADMWYHWDITGIVQEWVEATRGNYGLCLMINSHDGASFRSSDHPTATLRPKLVVYYRTW